MARLSDISAELKILGLPTDSGPTLAQVKKVVRENFLKKHPDKTEQQAGTANAGAAQCTWISIDFVNFLFSI